MTETLANLSGTLRQRLPLEGTTADTAVAREVRSPATYPDLVRPKKELVPAPRSRRPCAPHSASPQIGLPVVSDRATAEFCLKVARRQSMRGRPVVNWPFHSAGRTFDDTLCSHGNLS